MRRSIQNLFVVLATAGVLFVGSGNVFAQKQAPAQAKPAVKPIIFAVLNDGQLLEPLDIERWGRHLRQQLKATRNEALVDENGDIVLTWPFGLPSDAIAIDLDIMIDTVLGTEEG